MIQYTSPQVRVIEIATRGHILTGKEFNPFGQGEADVKAEAGIQGNKVKWFQIWKNGPKFAEYNVGVSGVSPKPEDYGGYYCWGKTTDKDANGDYNTGTGALTGDDDTATALRGENWRIPTKAEFDELLSNCTVHGEESLYNKNVLYSASL